MKIIVQPEPAGRGFQALLKGRKGVWARGDWPHEALGNLLTHSAAELGLTIEYGPGYEAQVRQVQARDRIEHEQQELDRKARWGA